MTTFREGDSMESSWQAGIFIQFGCLQRLQSATTPQKRKGRPTIRKSDKFHQSKGVVTPPNSRHSSNYTQSNLESGHNSKTFRVILLAVLPVAAPTSQLPVQTVVASKEFVMITVYFLMSNGVLLALKCIKNVTR